MQKLPYLIRVSVPQTKFDPDAVDTEIYCVNQSDTIFHISTKSESFTTIDEENGAIAHHGSDPFVKKLQTGDAVKIAEVKGWEWDGHVGIQVSYMEAGKDTIITKNYNLKESKSDFSITTLGLNGQVIKPLKY